MRSVFLENLRIVHPAHFPPSKGDIPLRVETPGNWMVSSAALLPGSANFEEHRSAWENAFDLSGRRGHQLNAGFSFNVLEIPSQALSSGTIDLRPLVLHGLDRNGESMDRRDPVAQAAIANAFWQTFWATGALRQERGRTFPVAFLPIDRNQPSEFEPPFRERYVSLRRRLFGRTSILAYVLEALTRARALFFDTARSRFVVNNDEPVPEIVVSAADIKIAIEELNRTAFPDAFTGDNRELFSRVAQAASRVRIHRVVPYAGCAFLNEVVNQPDALLRSGKIQDLDGEIIAATNSTFFLNFPEEYENLHCAMNDPVSVLVESGKTRHVKTMRRAAFVLTESGKAMITTRAGLKLNSQALVFEGEAASASCFDFAGKSFRASRFGPLFFGSIVVGSAIVETFESMDTEVPSNAWMIGDSEAFGGDLDPVNAAEVHLLDPDDPRNSLLIRHAFAVGPLLVQDGQMVTLGESREEFMPIRLAQNPSFEESCDLARTELPDSLADCLARGVPPTRFPYDWDATRAPRSAVGIKPDGSVLLVVVDGRADPTHSLGATLRELAQLMLNLGCRDAMNLDGGGSSVMYVNDENAAQYKLRPDFNKGVVSYPSDLGGAERLLPVPLVVLKKKPSADND